MDSLTTILALWGAMLSTVLAVVALYDRYVKHSGRLRIRLDKLGAHMKSDFTRPLFWLDQHLHPVCSVYEDTGLNVFDSILCFEVTNTSDTPVEIRFAEVFLTRDKSQFFALNHGPLGIRLPTCSEFCVFGACQSNIANDLLRQGKSLPAKCYLEVETTTGKKFRSKSFVVEEVIEIDLHDDGSETRKKVDYSLLPKSRKPVNAKAGDKP